MASGKKSNKRTTSEITNEGIKFRKPKTFKTKSPVKKKSPKSVKEAKRLAYQRRPSTQRKKAIKDFNRQRNRIRRFMRNAEKRGYRFDDIKLPEKIGRVSLDNTNKIKSDAEKLSKLKAKELYEKATAISSETGKVISGTEKRKEERRIAARKGKLKKYQKALDKQLSGIEAQDEVDTELVKFNTPEYYKPEIDTDFVKEQYKKDEANIKRLQQQEEFAEQFRTGEITYQTITGMINDALESGYKYAAFDLMSELNEQIATYGKEAVMSSIGNVPEDAIESATIALQYNPGSDQHSRAIVELRQIITGVIPSAEESAKLTDRIEQDAYTDFNE